MLLNCGLGSELLIKHEWLKLVGSVKEILRKSNNKKCMITGQEELGKTYKPLKDQDK